MDEEEVRAEIVKFFEIVAPLSRRILASKTFRVPAPALVIRPDKRDAWERGPHIAIGRWLNEERGTGVQYSERSPIAQAGAAGCYSPELNVIWVDSRSDDHRKFATLAHETAHALTYHKLLSKPHKGIWARTVQHMQSYNVGEVVAETASFVVTRQLLHHETAHSALYVADYAARERDVVGIFRTALPLATESAMAMIRAMEREN